MRITALFLAVLILLLVVPVQSIEINPSVENQPFFCKYELTDWTPLCVRSTTQNIIIEGEMNQTFNLTPNMTSGSDFQSSGFLFLNGSRPMEGNQILDKIEPYSFEYTYESGLDSTSRYYGFLAQNLETAGLSECVYTTNGTKTVYDRCISAYQMNVIKNQSEQIDSLTKRIEDLEKKP